MQWKGLLKCNPLSFGRLIPLQCIAESVNFITMVTAVTFMDYIISVNACLYTMVTGNHLPNKMKC